MDSLFNAFLSIGLLVVIVLVIYLVDRVNSLEKETHRVTQRSASTAPEPSDPWMGLQGKALWDAMTGRPPAYLSAAAMQELRGRYEVVLQKHIQSLFDEGVRDGQLGVSGEPKNPRTIQTAHGPVDSWMPTPQVNTLYKSGLDSVGMAPENLQPLRQAIDEAGQQLFSKTQFEQTEPLSASLLPRPAAPSALAAAPADSAAGERVPGPPPAPGA